MKKSIKRVLTTALAIAMMITMLAVPVYAGPTDTKTYVLMDDDMSVALKANTNYATESNTAFNAYYNGTQWGHAWDSTSQVSVANGDTVIKSYTGKDAGQATVVTKNIFSNSTLYSKSDITITYDVKTSSRSAEEVLIQNKVDDTLMSSYNTKTGVFKHEGYNGKSFTLAENTEYIIVHNLIYNDEIGNHQLTITITDKAGNATITDGEQSVSTATNTVWDFYKTDITNLSVLRFSIYSVEKATADGAELFTYQNIKIEQTVTGDILDFGNIQYNDDGIVFDEKMGDLDVAAINSITTSDAGYPNEKTWANVSVANNYVLNGICKTDGEYLWAKTDSKGATTNKMTKKFSSVPAGGKLTFTGTFRTQKPAEKRNYAVTLLLGNSDLSNTVSVIKFYQKNDDERYFIRSLGTNDAPSAWATTNGKVLYESKWLDNSTSPFYIGTDIPFTFTMAPNAEDGTKYDLSITTGISGDKIATSQIDATLAESLDTVGIYIYNSYYTEDGQNFMGLKNLRITTEGTHTALVAGNNKIYVPVENITGHATDFALIAAVCDMTTDEHKEYFVETYDEHWMNFDNLAIDVTITDPATEYVKLYIWDSFNNLIPYTEPKTTK